jgi:dTMP kinase
MGHRIGHDMTIPPPPAACSRGPLISAEGITGIGKTYLTRRAVEPLDAKPLLLDGLSQRTNQHPGLGRALLGSLRAASAGDPFLRGGAPVAEALILLAIKRHDLDTIIPELSKGRAVVEGRSVDTTAVCQALLLHPDDDAAALGTATALLELASCYRPLPDLTLLITDAPSTAVTRAEQRDRCVFTGEQVTFMAKACALFERLAATAPDRYRVLDRRSVDEHQAADLLRTWIRGAGADLGCLREPWLGPQARCLCCGRAADSVPA